MLINGVEFMMTGILRNSHCYVKCTSYQNADKALCKAGKDFACRLSKEVLETLKQQYSLCKKEQCSKLDYLLSERKLRNHCKQRLCDRKNVKNRIKEAESEYKRCQKDKSIPRKSPKNLVSGTSDVLGSKLSYSR